MLHRTRREKNHVTVVLGVTTVFMFAVATVHFAAVNEFTFREFTTNWTPESQARVGDPTQVQSITAEVVNVCPFMAYM